MAELEREDGAHSQQACLCLLKAVLDSRLPRNIDGAASMEAILSLSTQAGATDCGYMKAQPKLNFSLSLIWKAGNKETQGVFAAGSADCLGKASMDVFEL